MAARKHFAFTHGRRSQQILGVVIRPLVILSVVVGVLAASQLPAAACSCAIGETEEMLQRADGAFIGSLVASSPAAEPQIDDMSQAYTFEVTEWIKGNREPERFDVFSAGNGTACGFETPIGKEVAVFVYVHDGQATGGLCSTLDAASVRATVRPSGLSGNPGVFLASGWSEPIYILDDVGGLVAVQPERVDGNYGSLHTACGGSIIVEHRRNQIALVDVTTFQDVEVLQLERPTEQLMCDGDRVLALAGMGANHRIYDVRTREAISATVAEYSRAALRNGELIYMSAPGEAAPQGWRALDLESGDERVIVEMSTEVKRMESVDVSPDGSRIALTLAEGNQAVLDLVIVSVGDGDLVTRTVDTHIASVVWLDDDRLVVRTDSGGYPDTVPPFIASGDDLETILELDVQTWWPAELDGDRLLGFDGGTLLTMPVAGGSATVLNELPASYLQLVRLPVPVNVVADGSGSTGIETPIPSPAVEALATSPFVEEDAPASDPVIDESADLSDDLPAIEDVVTEDASSADDDPVESAASPVDSRDNGGLGLISVLLAAVVLAGLGTAVFHRTRKD